MGEKIWINRTAGQGFGIGQDESVLVFGNISTGDVIRLPADVPDYGGQVLEVLFTKKTRCLRPNHDHMVIGVFLAHGFVVTECGSQYYWGRQKDAV